MLFLIKNSLFARLIRVNGIVLYPFIFLAPKKPPRWLINHELIHVQQIRKHGFLGFYRRYLVEYFENRRTGLDHHSAYRGIIFEREAFDQQSNFSYLASSPKLQAQVDDQV
jgi:hypothetical protein